MELFDIEDAQSQSNKKLRICELEKLITKYQNSYYNGEGEIEDAQFDKLWDELKFLAPKSSVLKKIGADSGNFAKVAHIMPMGSQEKAATPEQFLEWAQKHIYPEYLVEYKLDGASLELQFQNGNLIKAVTRGDGIYGDDITQNAKVMQGIPSELYQGKNKIDFTGGIRGEVIMTHEVHKKYFPDKANCRNAANGLMKRKETSGCEYLKLIVYDALATQSSSPFHNELEKLDWLKSLGFFTTPIEICKTPEQVIDYRSKVMEIRKTLEYDIDGLVIKEKVINLEDAKKNRPDHQIAFKFSLEEAISIIRKVEWSESGSTYTPVAIFDPVELAGTTVQRASLANPDTLRSLGIKIGSHVIVVKRGEIIPKIERVVLKENQDEQTPVLFPTKCNVCKSELKDVGSRLFCPNKLCKKRILHRILKWIECLDIRDLGETLVTSLFNNGRIKNIQDIYSLTIQDLEPYFLGEESLEKANKGQKISLGAQKVFNSIQTHRVVRLSTFIAGFDIDSIGETMVEKLVEAGFDTLEKLLSANENDFACVYMFAKITASNLKDGLLENEQEMRFLADNGIITIENPKNAKLSGKSFCFTGELKTMKRQDAQALVNENGGSIKSTVTKDLSYLVTNDTTSGSSKNLKATKFGITIINEQQFLDMLK